MRRKAETLGLFVGCDLGLVVLAWRLSIGDAITTSLAFAVVVVLAGAIVGVVIGRGYATARDPVGTPNDSHREESPPLPDPTMTAPIDLGSLSSEFDLSYLPPNLGEEPTDANLFGDPTRFNNTPP